METALLRSAKYCHDRRPWISRSVSGRFPFPSDHHPGQVGSHSVYELAGRKSEPPDIEGDAFCRDFAACGDAYRRRAWSEALAIFREALRAKTRRRAEQRYCERSAAYTHQPPST